MGLSQIGGLIQLVLWIFIFILLARIVIDYVQLLARNWRPTGLLAVLCEGIYTVTDPPLRAIRRVVRPFRWGGAVLDLSPMILMIIVYLLFVIVGVVFN